MWAAFGGHVEVVRFLVANGADINAQDAYYGRTVLTWAAWVGHVEVVRLLIEKRRRH